MTRENMSRSWEIIGYDSSREIFRVCIPVGQITVPQLQALLQTLTAKHGLVPREIVDCFLKRNTKAYRADLRVTSENFDAKRTTNYYCGDNPHLVARFP